MCFGPRPDTKLLDSTCGRIVGLNVIVPGHMSGYIMIQKQVSTYVKIYIRLRLSEQVGHEISHQLKLHAGLHVRIYANLVVREKTLHVE